ncbi:hypothetical protein GCM10011611_46460 [Aliidongia dinghuensis]|uniref:DUF885 domain-containing protein n=1 Tax=Aliidongia dinghuensis TaxID=1867774 RepID=A0A8J3E5D4_9PROT|nr:DUF885 domain-containing protein [Aliidongia dinghuensis]GGF34940.1 hypothetical protein GCM10011611_46460 [Aliidongia dinghuensis]
MPDAADARLNQFLDDAFREELTLMPEVATMWGRPEGKARWGDQSDAGREAEFRLAERLLGELERGFPLDGLSPEGRLSHRLFSERCRQRLALEPHRWLLYPVTHMLGPHSLLPMTLVTAHQIATPADAEAYVARLAGLGPAIDQLLSAVEARRARGIAAPGLTYPKMIAAARALVTGQPFGPGGTSPLLADFTAKLDRLALPDERRAALAAAATAALGQHMGPAYRRFIAAIERLEAEVEPAYGLCRFPGGREAYAALLRRETTLELSAEAVSALGRRELARIHEEMHAIMTRVGFAGDLAAFIAWMREAPELHLENDAAGKAAYLARAQATVDAMQRRLSDIVGRLPKAALEVTPMVGFNQGSATAAFYTQPASDGSRPGYLEVNLVDVAQNPIYQIEALMHHEGVPGHHLQIAIAMELDGLPLFRRLDICNAHAEGWALYAEKFPKELGFYQDPYADFGRLSMEAWRAARLVVDPGIHHQGWSRDEAIRFMTENTAESPLNIAIEVDRYFVFPGQATSYAVGLIEILRLRAEAEAKLGHRFDRRQFHDTLLGHGSVPLPILSELVGDWVAARAA